MAKHTQWIVDRDENTISAADASVFDGRGEWVADFVNTAFANEAVNARNTLAGRDPARLEALVEAWGDGPSSVMDEQRVLAAVAAFLGEGDES